MSTTTVPATYPPRLDNTQRAQRVREALAVFAAANQQDEPGWLADPRMVTDISADLICAVLHHAVTCGADPAQVAAYGQGNFEQDVEEEGEHDVPTGFPPVVPRPLTMLREIFEILDGPDGWEAETIEHVAEVFTGNGFTIRDPEEHPENAELYQDAATAGASA